MSGVDEACACRWHAELPLVQLSGHLQSGSLASREAYHIRWHLCLASYHLKSQTIPVAKPSCAVGAIIAKPLRTTSFGRAVRRLRAVDFKALVRSQTQAPGTKALGPYPPLIEGVTPPVVVGGPIASRTPFSQREAGRHLAAYGGKDDAIDWVMSCVRLIVETGSNADWGFEKNGERLVKQRAPDTPKDAKEAPMMLVKLFEEPNPFMDYEELLELTLIDYLLVGNAYWMKWRTNDAGQPLALYRLAPPFVKAIPGPWGIEGYEYDVPGAGSIKMTPDQIVHFRQANPHSPYFGLGLVQGAARMLDLELALTDTQASYYEKRAQPSMVVQSDRRVPTDVFNRMKNQLRSMYGGPRNAGALMVLESGLKYQSISPSAQDAAFEQLTKLSRDRILSLFRVPPSMLGITNANNSINNADQRIFDTKTMRPLLNKFQRAVSRGLTRKAWDETDFVIDYEYIMPVEDRIRLTSSFAAIPGVRVREVREYAGLEPLGNEIDEMILNLPGEDGTQNNTHAGHPDNVLSGERGRPPNPSNTLAFPAPGGELPATAAVIRPKSLARARSGKAVIDRFKELEEAKAMEPAKIVIPDTLEADREAAIDELVADSVDDITRAIKNLERGLLDELEAAVEGKAPGDRLRSRLRKSEAWATFMAALSGILEKAAKSALSTSVVQQSRLGNRPEEDIDYDALAREIVFRAGGARKISANLRDGVAKRIARALEEDASRADLERAIREEMDFWRENHAETVALTEATHAYNEGVLTVAEATGHTHVFVHDGRDHDAPCVEADGSIWTIDHARENRLEHPRCRRAFTAVTV